MLVSARDVTASCGYLANTKRFLGKPVWRVELYRVSSYGRSDRYDSSDRMVAYHGRDECEARKLYKLALLALPSNGLCNENYNKNKAHLSITKDGCYETSSKNE